MSIKSISFALMMLFLTPEANAVLMDFTFDIEFTSGTLAPSTVPVFLTLDGFTGTGTESFDPSNSLVSFELTVNSIAFSAADALLFALKPEVRFLDGTLTFVDYNVLQPLGAGAGIGILYRVGGGVVLNNDVSFSSSDGVGSFDSSAGLVLPETFSPGNAVPTPATLVLFSIGLVGLGWSRRKQHS